VGGTTALYFAFGSNLLTTRLSRRCASARVVARAAANGYRVAFEKLSEDASGKATLVPCEGPSFATGVVYELSHSDIDALDAFEGPGYRRRKRFPVTCIDTGQVFVTCTYVARENVPGLRPYDWYLALILAGLAEHGIDASHEQSLRMSAYDVDAQRSRQSRRNALEDLESAGFADYSELLRSQP
jgi:hypothetical protein